MQSGKAYCHMPHMLMLWAARVLKYGLNLMCQTYLKEEGRRIERFRGVHICLAQPIHTPSNIPQRRRTPHRTLSRCSHPPCPAGPHGQHCQKCAAQTPHSALCHSPCPAPAALCPVTVHVKLCPCPAPAALCPVTVHVTPTPRRSDSKHFVLSQCM